MRRFIVATSIALLFAGATHAQVCVQGTQLKNDLLPPDPSGAQPIAVIRGLCEGDKAASVFDVSSIQAPVPVYAAGILFAGPPGSVPASGFLEIYDGITFNPNGSVVLGPSVYSNPLAPVQYGPNNLTVVDVAPFGVAVSSGKLVVAFTMQTNPNQNPPGTGCIFGYSASFATDSTAQPPTSCMSRFQTNLLFDASTGWWDVSRFQIGGQNWCGIAYNGNWVIRACVGGIPFSGTGENLQLLSSVNFNPLDDVSPKIVQAGDFFNLQVTSPMGTFLSAPTAVLADFYLTGGAVPPDLLPGLHMGFPFITLASTAGLGPLGMSQSIPVPGGVGGLSARFQGLTVSMNAANMLYATTRAHVAEIQ